MRKSNCRYCKKGIVLNLNCSKTISKYFCELDEYDEYTKCSNCYYYNKKINKNHQNKGKLK